MAKGVRNSGMSSRMKDVADRVGVSVTTVSHVLNKTRYVAPETRRKVLEAIGELDYYKNALARRLARGRSDFLGLVVSDITNPFFPELIKSFEASALARGMDLLLCNTNYDPGRTEATIRRMIENKVPGVAVMTSEISAELWHEVVSRQVAVVFLDLGRVGPWISNIVVDYSSGIAQAIHHLHDLGHQEVVFIAGPENLRSAITRRKAFIAALESWHLSPARTLQGNHKVDGGAQAVRTLLKQPNFPTAILCGNDLTAIGAMQALSDAGIKVPDEVSVVGFDDIDFAHLAYPPLTTINLSREKLGKLAFEALHKILSSKKHLGAEYVMECQLVVRQSTGPARKGPLRLATPVPGGSDGAKP